MKQVPRQITLTGAILGSLLLAAGCGGGTPQGGTPVAIPTVEQIAQWTPLPFAPLELLAVREWETTSFTSRIAPIADGRHFLTVGSRVLLWSITDDEPEYVFLDLTPEDRERNIAARDVAPDGKWFAVGDSNGMVRIWNLVDRKEIAARQLLDNDIVDLAISPDSRELATITYDNVVTTWAPTTLEAKNKFEVDTNSLKRIIYAAPGMLAVAGESTSLWDTATGKLVRQLTPGRYNYSLARSPDGSTLLFGGDDSLHLWNVAESKQESEITQAVSGSDHIAFSPDGIYLATSDGNNVRLWNLAERRLVQVIDGFGWTIVGLSWLPETNLLAVASEIGITRLWGTPADGAAVGLKPLHAPVALPDVAAKTPATSAQLQRVIDLRTLPRLPGSVPSLASIENFSCEAPVDSKEAFTFYRYFLDQAGWKVSEEASSNPTAVEFRKDGCVLSLNCYDAGDGKTTVSLSHQGNYDMRWTPKFDAAPIDITYESPSVVHYQTKADLVQIETNLLRKLNAAGWTAYSRLNSSYHDEPDQRDLEFLQNGTTLRVSIARVPTAPESYTIQYGLFPNNCWLPVPPDSGFVEFDGSTEPELVAVTKLPLTETRKFYDEQMAAHGWLPLEKRTELKEDHGWLTYFRGQCDATIALTKLLDGHTLVRVGDTSGSLWEAANAKEKPADELGLEAADFPVLNATAKYDTVGKTIELQCDATTLAAVAEQFITALEGIGWKSQEGGIRDEEYTMIDFANGDREFTLRARRKDGKAVVNIQGDGLLWNKELPGGTKVVAYETWLRLNKLPPGLDFLDKYEAEMRAIAE